jgi:hypothetical protein
MHLWHSPVSVWRMEGAAWPRGRGRGRHAGCDVLVVVVRQPSLRRLAVIMAKAECCSLGVLCVAPCCCARICPPSDIPSLSAMARAGACARMRSLVCSPAAAAPSPQRQQRAGGGRRLLQPRRAAAGCARHSHGPPHHRHELLRRELQLQRQPAPRQERINANASPMKRSFVSESGCVLTYSIGLECVACHEVWRGPGLARSRGGCGGRAKASFPSMAAQAAFPWRQWSEATASAASRTSPHRPRPSHRDHRVTPQDYKVP